MNGGALFFGKKRLKTKYQSFIMQKSEITMSLQVPCSPLNIIYKIMNHAYHPGKRVLPFTLQKQLSASMTVEAAFVLPLFVFFSTALLVPIHWLDTQRKIQMVTERFCEELSQYVYVMEPDGLMEVDHESAEETGIEEWISVFSDKAAGLWLKGRTEKYTDQVQIREAQVRGEDEMICFKLSYREHIPFFPVSRDGIIMGAAANRRCWTGLDGKLKEAGEEIRQTEKEMAMVYVGANMGRYHMYRDCHYISNIYQAVSYREAGKIRTPDGMRLDACSYCAGKVSGEDMVYITPSGKHYHSRKDCGSMNAYVRKVPLEEVEYLGMCSYCERKGNGS